MEIRIEDVEKILKKLLSDKISREEASSWAYSLRLAEDDKKLVCFPESDEDILWKCILFIEGIDLLVEPNVYLHDKEDIQDFLKSIEQ